MKTQSPEDHPAASKDSREMQQHRRRYVIRMLVLPLVLTVILVGLLSVGREMFHKRIYINGMTFFSVQMEAFKTKNHRYPGAYEVEDFDHYSRLPRKSVSYEEPPFAIDCPQNLPIAWTAPGRFHFLGDGRAVLMHDASVQWIASEPFDALLKKREQYRHAQMLEKSRKP